MRNPIRSTPGDVDWLARVLWPQRGGFVDSPQMPADHGVESYTVLPSSRWPYMIVPWGEPTVARRALLNHNGMRSARAQRAFRLVAAGVGSLGRWFPRGPSMRVGSPVAGASSSPTLRMHLMSELGLDELFIATLVAPHDPNRKPTLHLLDRDGEPIGYAKVGWNAATTALVRHEAASIAAVGPALDPVLAVPAVLAEGEWGDLVYTVVEPLPLDVTGVPRHVDLDQVAGRMARLVGHDASTTWHDSGFRAALHRRASALAADATGGGRGDDVLGLLSRMDDSAPAEPVETGLSHGDWAPWNMAWSTSRLWVWDWEYTRSGVPVGMDVLHHAFQDALVGPASTPADLASAVDLAAAQRLPAIGVPTSVAALLADAYLVDRYLRQYELKVGSGEWDARMHPGLTDVMGGRPR